MQLRKRFLLPLTAAAAMLTIGMTPTAQARDRTGAVVLGALAGAAIGYAITAPRIGYAAPPPVVYAPPPAPVYGPPVVVYGPPRGVYGPQPAQVAEFYGRPGWGHHHRPYPPRHGYEYGHGPRQPRPYY